MSGTSVCCRLVKNAARRRGLVRCETEQPVDGVTRGALCAKGDSIASGSVLALRGEAEAIEKLSPMQQLSDRRICTVNWQNWLEDAIRTLKLGFRSSRARDAVFATISLFSEGWHSK